MSKRTARAIVVFIAIPVVLCMYVMMHREANLSQAEKQQLVQGLQASLR